jgi:hypothetical protein
MGSIELVSTGIPNLLQMKGRSPGLHHSSVLSDLLTRMGHWAPPIIHPNQESQDREKVMVMTRMQLGQAFEEILVDRYARTYPDRYYHPGELEIDGLPITPDLVDSLDYGPDSIKYTWLSSKHPIYSDKFTYHWMQIMSECIALHSDIGRLHICHNMGDYSYGNDAVVFNVWQQQFTRQELDHHRTIILKHRDRMLKEGWVNKWE